MGQRIGCPFVCAPGYLGEMTEQPRASWHSVIGPGIVFAGAAIGVSHLIQATRAGATFGLSLLLLVILVHALKYPALSFAPRYVAASGKNLLQAYRAQGVWAVLVFAITQIGTMFTIVAAIAIVTAQVIVVAIGSVTPLTIDLSLTTSSAIVFTSCAALLATGGYTLLERTLKVLMVVLCIATLAAAAAISPTVFRAMLDEGPTRALIPRVSDAALLAFAIPLVGWMPAPLDISVWNSLWCKEQSKSRGRQSTQREAKVDFNTGYLLCCVNAVCFLLMGAALIYYPGIEPATGNAPLVEQLLSLYESALGSWITPVIAVCAIGVMYSTTITVLDALPRTLIAIRDELKTNQRVLAATPSRSVRTYWVFFFVLCTGALLIIHQFTANLRALVDLATTLSFIGTPMIAYLNHRAIFSDDVPCEHRPGWAFRVASMCAIVLFVLSACGYIAYILL